VIFLRRRPVTFEILSAKKDSERWSALIHALPASLRDIHFLPEYGLIYRESYDFEPLLAVFRSDEGFVLQPFVRRPLKNLPFLEGSGNFTDIANAYGFGGPLSNLSGETARTCYRAFSECFSEWCDREEIASEFTVLHPLFRDQQLDMLRETIEPHLEKDVVVVDLAGPVVNQLNRGQRSNVNKAERMGVVVTKVEASAENLATFRRLYIETMERHHAAERWYVPENHFSDCFRFLGSNRCSLFFAKAGAAVESAYLLIHDFETAYYFFAGNRGASPEYRAANLAMLKTAEWAKDAGYKRYFLGGGVTSALDDSLLRFKAGFSEQRAPLYTYFTVRNRPVYDELCERKRAFERKTLNAESASGFLPLYRR
jgi:hypothetical protein